MFRLKFKKIIEKYFKIEEYGEQKVEVRGRNNNNTVFAEKIQGVVYGDGGAYLECNAEDVIFQDLVSKETRSFFDLYSTADKSIAAYLRKQTPQRMPDTEISRIEQMDTRSTK